MKVCVKFSVVFVSWVFGGPCGGGKWGFCNDTDNKTLGVAVESFCTFNG